MVQYGGEVVNTRPSGFHTSTQMGSGHFAGEGFGKASYFRNLQVVDWDNSLIPLSNLRGSRIKNQDSNQDRFFELGLFLYLFLNSEYSMVCDFELGLGLDVWFGGQFY
ncbi:unnamed protein product, partial [Vitis vinifera]